MVVAIATAFALLPASATAYRIGGERWPGAKVPVVNTSIVYRDAVATALRAWNRAGAGVKFERASRARARVVIEDGAFTRCTTEGGLVKGAGWPGPFVSRTRLVVNPHCPGERLRTTIVAHELGHILGLAHYNRRCAVMNADADFRSGRPKRCSRRMRAVLSSDDVRGARVLSTNPSPQRPVLARFGPVDGASLIHSPRPVQFATAYNGELLRYRWDFGDPDSGGANQASGTLPQHSYRRPGTYLVTLTVTYDGVTVARRSNRITLQRLGG